MAKNSEAVATPEEVVMEKMKAPTTFKVGKLDLTINKDNDKFLPHETNIVGNLQELETIALGIKNNLPVLLIGDTGTGKTSFIRYLAQKTNNGFRRLNLNGSTTADELVGHYVVDDKEKGMRWIDGVLLDAMRNGYWILLDELNAGLPEVLFILQSVLDDDKFLVVAEHEGEVVKPHPNFRVFATMNPSLEYAGTRDLNKALLSRFPIVIQTNYPDAVHEIEIIKTHVPSIKDDEANVMVRVAENIRKGKKADTISFICSTRELINWAKLSVEIGLKPAAILAILNKCEIATDKTFVEDNFKMHFGKWEKGQIITLTEIEAQLEKIKEDSKNLSKELKEKDNTIKAQTEELNSFRKVLNMAQTAAAKIPSISGSTAGL